MRLTSTLTVSLRALRRNTMRSILTALGIIIGVGAVIAMVSIGNGAKAQVQAQVASLGENVITIFPGSFTSGGMRSGWGSASTLTPEDAEAIRREVPNVYGVSPEVRDRSQVLANGLNWNTQIMGEGPDYPDIRSWKFAEGSMFTDQDVRSVAKVAVIGKTEGNGGVNDFTRIATLQYTNSVGGARMRWIGVEEGHHSLSHESDENNEAVEKLTKINKWFCEQLAYLTKRLAETPEPGGQGSLLDNTLIL